jgi:hypothetical protein
MVPAAVRRLQTDEWDMCRTGGFVELGIKDAGPGPGRP